MSKKLLTLLILAVSSGWGSWLVCQPVAAATYTTPVLPTASYHFSTLTWLTTGSERAFSLHYQTSPEREADGDWQTLPDISCRDQGEDRTECFLDLPAELDEFFQLQLDYPDDSELLTFNLHLQTITPPETPPVANEQIYYSDFKTLDPQLTATQLSWQEEHLTDPYQDRIVVQTRASYDGQTWTDWSGNLELTALTPHQDFTATTSGLLLTRPLEDNFDFLQVTYRSAPQSYLLTDIAARGSDEAAAFANTTLTLDTLDDLHLGETLILRETVNEATFEARGLISDLKPGDNLVSVFAWQGAIPYRPTSQCEGDNFCFTTAAQVSKLTDVLLPAAVATTSAQLTLPTATGNPLPITPELTTVHLATITTPTCLESTNPPGTAETTSADCQLASLPLSHYYQTARPTHLQYRIISGFAGDTTVTNVFLHQDTPAGLTTPNITPTGLNRLRGGKNFDASTSRPYYWH